MKSRTPYLLQILLHLGSFIHYSSCPNGLLHRLHAFEEVIERATKVAPTISEFPPGPSHREGVLAQLWDRCLHARRSAVQYWCFYLHLRFNEKERAFERAVFGSGRRLPVVVVGRGRTCQDREPAPSRAAHDVDEFQLSPVYSNEK